jgi:hypothetical protein
MGKKIKVQRRGRGGSQFKARKVGKIASSKYPKNTNTIEKGKLKIL